MFARSALLALLTLADPSYPASIEVCRPNLSEVDDFLSEDGAEEFILKRGTHVPPRHVMALYTSVQWKTLCREVAKLALERPAVASAVALR